MLRRTKTQTLNGKALIELPSRDLKIISCPFDTYEKTFYEALETRMGNELQNLQQQEKVSYISALVLLLRLRQGVSPLVSGEILTQFSNSLRSSSPCIKGL
jgi:SNF2 family DNA or RNA helicase